MQTIADGKTNGASNRPGEELQVGAEHVATNEGRWLSAKRCLETLFDEESRPGLRTWADWKDKGYLPFKRIGRRCYYDLEEVKAALDKQFTIHAR